METAKEVDGMFLPSLSSGSLEEISSQNGPPKENKKIIVIIIK